MGITTTHARIILSIIGIILGGFFGGLIGDFIGNNYGGILAVIVACSAVGVITVGIQITDAEQHRPTRQDFILIAGMYGVFSGMVAGLGILITNEWFATGAVIGMIHGGVHFDDIAKKLPSTNQRFGAC